MFPFPWMTLWEQRRLLRNLTLQPRRQPQLQ